MSADIALILFCLTMFLPVLIFAIMEWWDDRKIKKSNVEFLSCRGRRVARNDM